MDDELKEQAVRMVKRAGMPLGSPPSGGVKNSNNEDYIKTKQRLVDDVEQRKEWETKRSTHLYESENPNKKKEDEPTFQRGVTVKTGRSALSNRAATNSKPDIFMPEVGLDPKEFADSKQDLETELKKEIKGAPTKHVRTSAVDEAAAKTSEIVAKAGAGNAFEGNTLGIGGLDEVLSQVKRRVWVPLAGEFHYHSHMFFGNNVQIYMYYCC